MNYHEVYTAETLQNMVTEVNGWDGSLEYLQHFEMEEFNDIMGVHDPEFIAQRIHFGDFSPMDDYFNFDSYGNLESLSSVELDNELTDYAFEIVERYDELTAEGVLDGDLLADIENKVGGD